MSTIKSGRSTHSRRGTNFPTKPAQKRIDESLAPFRDKIENALDIDSVEAIVFKRVRAGRPCICSQHHVTAEDMLDGGAFEGFLGNGSDDIVTSRPVTNNKSNAIFKVASDDIFGEANYQRSTAPKEIELADLPKSNLNLNEKPVYQDEVFVDTDFVGGSELCGICYNQGIIPAFETVNYSYNILTVHDMTEIDGYYSNTKNLPASFQRKLKDGFVAFELVIPKYFIEASFSIRNNIDVLGGSKVLYTKDKKPLTRAYLDANRGSTVSLYVMNVDEFTHAIVMFKLNDFEIRANISTENEVINYENEVTIGDMNVVMSYRSGSIRSEDFLVIPKRNLVLKINGAPRKSMANKLLWQWALTARAVQRSEPAARIFKHYKIY